MFLRFKISFAKRDTIQIPDDISWAMMVGHGTRDIRSGIAGLQHSTSILDLHGRQTLCGLDQVWHRDLSSRETGLGPGNVVVEVEPNNLLLSLHNELDGAICYLHISTSCVKVLQKVITLHLPLQYLPVSNKAVHLLPLDKSML